MEKIPTLYVRNTALGEWRYVLDEVNPSCEWVLAGEGQATRKYDGTCVMFDGADWWARREVRDGKETPDGWYMADYDEVTGKSMGWEPIAQSSFAKFHAEALEYGCIETPGTYELCWPKINGNPEGFPEHQLVPHGFAPLQNVPTNFAALREFMVVVFGPMGREGVVWHHPDGRKAKLKVRDFPPCL